MVRSNKGFVMTVTQTEKNQRNKKVGKLISLEFVEITEIKLANRQKVHLSMSV